METKTKTPSADESARILTDYIKRQEPFFFVRYGDGATECIYGEDSRRTCDGELYTRQLAAALLKAWVTLQGSPHTVFAGDWQSASFGGKTGNNRETGRWRALTSDVPFRWLHFETLLLMRKSVDLVNFYRQVRSDPRPKVYLGPTQNALGAKLLGARHVVTPMVPDLITKVPDIVSTLEAIDFDILLYGAGLAGNVAAVKLWERFPDRTYISLGSAFDALCGKKTRTQQLPRLLLLEMFKGLL